MLVVAASFAGACTPKDFEDTSEAETDEPFGGGARGGTGSTPTGGGPGKGCGDVSEVGACMGDFIRFCDDGMLVEGDCRSIDPMCRCAFNEAQGVNDCLCGGSGGTGGGGGTGVPGGSGGTGTAGTGAEAGGASATGGRGGTAGSSGAATGGAPMCGGVSCTSHAECCSGFQCVSFDDAAPVCAASCTRNSACASECCALLGDYSGACGPVATCGGTGCRPLGASCDTAAECCAAEGAAARCIDPGRGGPRVCAAPCTVPSDCTSSCCRRDGTGVQACVPAELCP
jgi:hypothetical protein